MIRVRKDIGERIVLTNGRGRAIESIKRNMTWKSARRDIKRMQNGQMKRPEISSG